MVVATHRSCTFGPALHMACFASGLRVEPAAAGQKCVACERRGRHLVRLVFQDAESQAACVCRLCLEACRAIQLAPLELDERGVLLPNDAHLMMLVAYLSASGDAMPRDDNTLRQLAGLRSKSILALLTTLCPQLQQQKKRWSQLHVQTHGATAGSSRNGITGVQLQTRGLLPCGSLSAAATLSLSVGAGSSGEGHRASHGSVVQRRSEISDELPLELTSD